MGPVQGPQKMSFQLSRTCFNTTAPGCDRKDELPEADSVIDS